MKLDSAFLVGDKPKQKTVTLPDGTDHELYFKQIPAQDFVVFREEQQSEDAAVRTTAVPRLIAKSLCDESGKPVLTGKEHLGLTPAGCTALMQAVMEVNTFDAKKASPSEEATGSDTN